MLEAEIPPTSRTVQASVRATGSKSKHSTVQPNDSATTRYARFVVATHASVTTLDRFGKEVPSVVWVAPYAGRLLVWRAATSGMVQRIEANPSIQIAPCDEQGRLLYDPARATARVMFGEEKPTVSAAMGAKYGWRFALVRSAGWVARLLFIRPRGYVGIELQLQ